MNYFLKIICFAVIALYLADVSPILAEERPITENQAKAAFVFNVLRYVNWPASTGSTLEVCILGKGTIPVEWQIISGKMVNGKKLHIFKSNDLDEMLDCQIVFIDETDHKKLSRILLLLRNAAILTIADSPNFTDFGGILGVSIVNNRISFTANLAQARANGLEISSNLLKLATEVIK